MKPEPHELCEHTHTSIVTERLTVRHPEGKSSVTMIGGRSTTGLWVTSDEGFGCVGLIYQEGVGPYLAVYSGKEHGLPSVALGPEGFQLPKEGFPHAPVYIKLTDLFEALKSLKG
jgi:hypothetical protein